MARAEDLRHSKFPPLADSIFDIEKRVRVVAILSRRGGIGGKKSGLRLEFVIRHSVFAKNEISELRPLAITAGVTIRGRVMRGVWRGESGAGGGLARGAGRRSGEEWPDPEVETTGPA